MCKHYRNLKTVGFYGLVVVATGVATWPCCDEAMTIPAIAAAPSASGTMVSLSCACFTPAGFPAGSGLTAKAGEKIRLDARHAPITVVRNFIREPQNIRKAKIGFGTQKPRTGVSFVKSPMGAALPWPLPTIRGPQARWLWPSSPGYDSRGRRICRLRLGRPPNPYPAYAWWPRRAPPPVKTGRRDA